jgi:hypothetical protein
MSLIIPQGEKLGPRVIIREDEEWQLRLQGSAQFTIRSKTYTLIEGDVPQAKGKLSPKPIQ